MAKRRKMKVEEQMDMLEEGGLLDEGGTVDPVSGNDVPSGSTQEEVRDDIPAQLSEGEFVFPADVVRYIGLENLMELRQKAKAGLQKMEDMGQMGNAEEAIMDDTGEYKDEIGSMIDNLELAQGGMVPQQNIPPIGPPVGNTMPGQVAPPMPTTSAFQMQPSTAMNQTTRPNLAMAQGGAVMTVEQEMMQKSNKPQNFAQGGAVMSVEQEMMQKSGRTGYAQGGAVIPVEQEMMQKRRQNFQVGGMPQPVPTITPPTQVPTYSQFMGQTTPGQGPASPVVYGTDQYIGPNGDIIGITTINGNPIQDIPAGYKKYNPATDMPAQPAVAQPVVQERDGGSDDREVDSRADFDYGLSRTQQEDILSTINTDLTNAIGNRPKNAVDFITKGLIGNIAGAIQRGYYTEQAANQVRSGENLTNPMKPDYANWRSNASTALAASMLETENEAKDVLSGDRDLEGSSFASEREAEAVANSGWGSDDHFDAIESDFDDLESTQPDNQSFAQPDYAPPDFSGRDESDGPDNNNNEVGDDSDADGGSFGSPDGWD